MHSKLILTATLLATLGAAPAAHAAFPGTNGDILFGAYDERTDEAGLYALELGGTPSLLASTGYDTPDSADVSPDGKRVLWSEGYDIFVADRDGTNAKQLTPEDGRDWTPSWGPDSRTIVFAERDENNDWILARMNADGTGRQRIGDGIQGVQPALSPDGKTIAYAGWDEFDFEGSLNLVDAAGQTAPVEIAQGIDPEWVPDGRSLVFTYYDYESIQLALYKVDVATEDITPITDLGGDVAYARPSVSPDGKHIVAMSARYIARSGRGSSGDGLTLRTMDIDGSDVEVLADTETARDPDWAPGPPAPRQDDQQGPATQQQSQSPAAPRAASPSLGARVCRSRRYFTVSVRGSRIGRVAMTLAGRRLKVRRRDGAFTARVDLRQLPKGRFTVKIRKTLKGGGTRAETRRYRTCVPKPRG